LKPKFILLDELFAGIDPIAVEDIMTIVHNPLPTMARWKL
jgi:ABC-type lipopolysaccharide export system ATPase subunit